MEGAEAHGQGHQGLGELVEQVVVEMVLRKTLMLAITLQQIQEVEAVEVRQQLEMAVQATAE